MAGATNTKRRPLIFHVATIHADGVVEHETFMQTTYRIELKVDIDPAREDAHEVIREVCRQAARTLFAQALLVSGKRKPQIAVHGDTFFEDTTNVKVFDDDDDEQD